MASPVKLYQQEMHNNLGFFATWLPSNTLEIGDIGVFDGGQFRRQGSLQEFGIAPPRLREGEPQKLSYSACAERKVQLGVGARAIVPAAGAELSIHFTQEGGFVFEAEGVRQVEVADRLALSHAVLGLYRERVWKDEWHLIDSVYCADSATILVSEDRASDIVLAANAAIAPGPWRLADPKLSLSVSSSSGKIMCVIAATGLRPLYSCVKIRHHFFSDPSVEPVRGEAKAPNAMTRPSIDELLES